MIRWIVLFSGVLNAVASGAIVVVMLWSLARTSEFTSRSAAQAALTFIGAVGVWVFVRGTYREWKTPTRT